MKRWILILITFFCTYSRAQEYEFLNKFIEDNIPAMALQQQWEPMLRFDGNKISEEFLREQWQPIKAGDVPDIEPFLSGINIQHLSLFINNVDSVGIESKRLKTEIKLVSDTWKHLNNGGTYCQISKPFISCSKDWVIILFACHSQMVSGGSDWYIYRKVRGEWQFYYKIGMYLG